MSTRRYRQHCGLAHALDVLGERWSLLVLRELSLGPKRYGDLLANLPGVGTNLLAARLKRLEEAGVLRRTTLPPPANVPVYELTERGEALRPMLEELALWGYELLPEGPSDETVRAAWAAMSMGAVTDRHGPGDVRGTFAFTVGDERFHVTVQEDGAQVRTGVPTTPADVEVTADPTTFFALAGHATTPAQAERAGTLTVTGDRRRLDDLLTVFHLPERAAA